MNYTLCIKKYQFLIERVFAEFLDKSDSSFITLRTALNLKLFLTEAPQACYPNNASLMFFSDLPCQSFIGTKSFPLISVAALLIKRASNPTWNDKK